MKTKIGGDRLGSGGKMEVVNQHFNRSSHAIGNLWRSSMASGTLVPFMGELALSGTSMEINLACEVLTVPTLGPLFGSYKVQLDVFQIPIRLYNKALTMNKLNIGNNMQEVKIPQLKVYTHFDNVNTATYDDNEQIHSSCLLKYLGIRGIGSITGTNTQTEQTRDFNAVKLLSYWEIYKNFYANSQEERGYGIHTGLLTANTIYSATLTENGINIGDILDTPLVHSGTALTGLRILFEGAPEGLEPDPTKMIIDVAGERTVASVWPTTVWDGAVGTLTCSGFTLAPGNQTFELKQQKVPAVGGGINTGIQLKEFPLENIDTMREQIMEWPFASGTYTIDKDAIEPYSWPSEQLTDENDDIKYACQYTQESLALKTYQSDLFNNWISTEWIDGVNGVNEVTKVSTVGDAFTIDSLNLAQKVYKMLNRIAISGGTYDDWLDAVYDQDRITTAQTPIYHGSLIKELAFQEVISNSASLAVDGATVENGDPLGTLAGRGRLTDKHKGGKMVIKSDEPSYIMGIASITPRIDYSQGNKWDNNLKTYDDFHKPDLDAIGYQDLITDQMAWQDTQIDSDTGEITYKSAGKQPSWLNYMTNVNEVYGNFAEVNKEMFMVLNRRYDINEQDGRIEDLTTYIDPSKFNFIFAEQRLDAQNFWVHISKKITARRKMSAKQIPNL